MSHGPQHTRLVAKVLVGGLNEREMTLLDWLRFYGPLSLEEAREVLGHSSPSPALRYLTNLVAAGLAEPAPDEDLRRFVRGSPPSRWRITEHGRTVA